MRTLAVVSALLLLLLFGVLAGTGDSRPEPVLAAPARQEATPAGTVCDTDFERPAFYYVFETNRPDGGTPSPEELRQTLTVLDDRMSAEAFDPLASLTHSARLDPGSNRIELGLKRIRDEGLVERLLQRVGQVELIDASTELPPPGMGITTSLEATAAAAAGTPLATGPIHPSVFSSADIDRRAIRFLDDEVVQLVISDEAAQRLREVTAAADVDAQPLTLLLDEDAIWSTTVGQPLDLNLLQLSGMSAADARSLAVVLRSGPLPMPLVFVSRSQLTASQICQ